MGLQVIRLGNIACVGLIWYLERRIPMRHYRPPMKRLPGLPGAQARRRSDPLEGVNGDGFPGGSW